MSTPLYKLSEKQPYFMQSCMCFAPGWAPCDAAWMDQDVGSVKKGFIQTGGGKFWRIEMPVTHWAPMPDGWFKKVNGAVTK